MADEELSADWWTATCELCPWRTRTKHTVKQDAVDAGQAHSQKKHPESWHFRVRGYTAKNKTAPAVVDELHGRVVELLARVLEYEHALEHVVQPDHHSPTACTDCQGLAQSALDGVNREGFTEIARDALSW